MEENVSCQTSVPSVGCDSPLSELYHHYRWYAVNVRAVSEETIKKHLLYVRRTADYFGAPDTVGELFAALHPDSISDLLIDYAARYSRGSQCCMQTALRSFPRFAYLRSYISRDLSELVPSVRAPKHRLLNRFSRSDSPYQLSDILRQRMKELGVKPKPPPPEGVSHGCHGFPPRLRIPHGWTRTFPRREDSQSVRGNKC